ncbi:AAA family ATPase [Catenulispora rubra]|uniref:AAA family ATPase n=1 Tax=Catenulispora rubra TaxID=280293 RepID=UPI001892742A|nr:AAA family ATPase [Catenulispora rubra]
MSSSEAVGPQPDPPDFPAFVDEVAGTLAVHSQYVLHGNLRDQFPVRYKSRAPRPTSLLPLLWQALEPRGYECFICFDTVDGISVYPETPAALSAAQRLLGNRAVGRRPTLERMRPLLAKVVGAPEQPPADADTGSAGPIGHSGQGNQRSQGSHSGQDGQSGQGTQGGPAEPTDYSKPVASPPPVRAAVVFDYASRITHMPGQLDAGERDFFLYCLKLALTAKPLRPQGADGYLFNPIIWLADGDRDLPAWLTAGADPIRTVAVGLPTLGDRQAHARVLVSRLPSPPADTKAAELTAKEFASRTDGLTLRSMTEIARLSLDRDIAADRVADAVRIYKLGVEQNPWRYDSIRAHILDGEKVIRDNVIGQERAVGKTLDILKRAALGLSGAQATNAKSRPRSVLFFAGPTGVGKTELAKQVAALLFGDVDSYLRFDMSEFAADHAVDRLIGAPPGYVGYEAGGELTGAVRRNPFRVVVFDEIEKAHRPVLDKLLQILEDGRLTDGQGVTTYFSECVLIFTSNLGIVTTDPEMPYSELERKVTAAVRDHFTTRIGRPELLNRLGDDIVVFDFIGAAAAEQICAKQIDTIVRTIDRELEIGLSFDDAAREQLIKACVQDSANGGRGIGNRLESHLINPLARLLFDEGVEADSLVEITAALPGDVDSAPRLRARVTPGGRR